MSGIGAEICVVLHVIADFVTNLSAGAINDFIAGAY